MTEVKVSINGRKGPEGENENLYQLDYYRANPRFKKILEELEELIGLEQVKDKIKEICALIEIQSKRREKGLVSEPQSLHMIFKGNPFITEVKNLACI